MERENINNFLTFSKSQLHLQSSTNEKNILQDIEEFLCKWNFNSEYDLTVINEDIDNVIVAIKNIFFENNHDPNISKSIHCVVHNLLWDNLKSILRGKYAKDDQNFYEKCQMFCKNRSLELKSDNSPYCSVPCTAAIVELSMWDTYNSPLEKLNCLCRTYDIIFAELKTALVTVISKYSERDLDIPVINNEEVIPVISLVMMKSKLKYSISNLMYVILFGQKYLEDVNKRYILETFERSIHNILTEDGKYLQLGKEIKEYSHIDFREVIEKMNSESSRKINASHENPSLQDENRKRLLSLILISTTNQI